MYHIWTKMEPGSTYTNQLLSNCIDSHIWNYILSNAQFTSVKWQPYLHIIHELTYLANQFYTKYFYSVCIIVQPKTHEWTNLVYSNLRTQVSSFAESLIRLHNCVVCVCIIVFEDWSGASLHVDIAAIGTIVMILVNTFKHKQVVCIFTDVIFKCSCSTE